MNEKAEKLRNKSTRELINTINEGVAEPPIYNSGRRRAEPDLHAEKSSLNSGKSYGAESAVNGKLTDFTAPSHGNSSQNSISSPLVQKRKIDEPAVMAKWFQGRLYVKIEYAGNIWLRQIDVEPESEVLNDGTGKRE